MLDWMVNCNICGWHLFLCRYPKLVVIAWSDYRPRETERPRDLCVPCDQRAVVVFNSIVFVVIVRGRRWFKKKCHSRKYTYNWRRKKKLLTRKQAKTIYDGPDSDDEYRANNGQPGCRCGGERRRSSSRKWWVIDAKCSYKVLNSQKVERCENFIITVKSFVLRWLRSEYYL